MEANEMSDVKKFRNCQDKFGAETNKLKKLIEDLEEKEIAYDRIRCECAYNDGFDLRICSANTFAFTMAYSYYVGDKVHLRYHTRDNVYDFEIEE